MTEERRFSEKEIAAIFEQAAEAQRVAHDHPSAEGGLTLAELKEIGADVGISAEFVTRASQSIDSDTHLAPRQTFLGLPVSASHTIDIPGPFTGEDWDRLVADLRQTFQAGGEINLDGSLREWRNGNLYALVEPTSCGARLRLATAARLPASSERKLRIVSIRLLNHANKHGSRFWMTSDPSRRGRQAGVEFDSEHSSIAPASPA